jgi:apolipoprotein N-acyltransferase
LWDAYFGSQYHSGSLRNPVVQEICFAGIAAGGRTQKLVELSRDSNQPAFVTTFPDASKPKPYNAAVMFFEGKESKPYFKRRPFAGESLDHEAGEMPGSAPFGNFAVGLNICFDSCYPNLLRDTARLEGVRIVALPCMGPESPYGVIQAIHGAFTPFRSAELGVPIARGESSAFAMITDASGRIVAQAPPGYQGLLIGDVETTPRWTVVRFLGDWFLYLSWSIVFVWAIKSIRSALLRRSASQAVALESTEPSVSSS